MSHNSNTNNNGKNLHLGMIGNCAYSALVDPQARMVWCCLPRFDGDPVFNALLDEGPTGSVWAFEIENFARSEQQYEPNTAILKTRLYDTDGHGVEVIDFYDDLEAVLPLPDESAAIEPEVSSRCQLATRPLVTSPMALGVADLNTMAGVVRIHAEAKKANLRPVIGCRPRLVTGEEALELGLATRLADDPLAAARELARDIAAVSPDAVRAAKRLANAGAAGAPEPDLLLAEAVEQQALLASFNHREALQAHAEKRAPLYRD